MADYDSAGFDTLYPTVLGLNSGGITGALKTVQDGAGNDTALQVSTGGVKSTGTIESTGDATIGGSCTATSFSGSATGLTSVRGVSFSKRTLTTSGSVSDADELLIMNGSSLSLTLQDANDIDGKSIVIMNIASTAVTLVMSSQTSIGSGTTTTADRTLAAYSSVTLVADNGAYYIIAGEAS